MTRKLTRNSFLVALLTILIFVIAIVAPAQRTSSAPSSAQNAIASPQQNSSTSSPELELRPSPDSSAALAIRSQTTRHHARPLDETLPLFSPEVDYPSGGSSASSVAVADLNHDGKPDIVVAISGGGVNGDGMVGVLLGNGNGTFQTAVTYDTGDTGSFSVAVADLNGDGKPDIAVANCSSACATGSVSILLGNGDGTFQPAVVYQTKGYQTRSVGRRRRPQEQRNHGSDRDELGGERERAAGQWRRHLPIGRVVQLGRGVSSNERGYRCERRRQAGHHRAQLV
jgi:hypothetical protein